MHPVPPDLPPALADIDRRWGSNTLRPLAALPDRAHQPHIPTGLPTLDAVLSSGIPQRRLTLLTGIPTAGTTVLSYRLMAEAQHIDQIVVYLDLSRCFDLLAAQRCGVEMDSLLLIHPETVRDAVALLRDLAAEDSPLLAVLDGLLLRHPLPDLSWLHAVLRPSRMTLLVLLPPVLATGVPSDVHLHVAREAWLYQRRDVTGIRSRITVQKAINQPEGQTVTVDVPL